MVEAVNIHATAVMIGRLGILFTGPSGSGKSMTAFACMVAARRQSIAAMLIADDQVLISNENSRLVAHRPDATAGLIELRGSGIVKFDSIPQGGLHLAVCLISLPGDDRLPPENEIYSIPGKGDLPMVRLWQNAPEPLAFLSALSPVVAAEVSF